MPDGATVDAEGFLWSVSVYEGKLVRFAPDGRLDRVVGLPVESTTSLSFGGPDLDIAYRDVDGANRERRPAEGTRGGRAVRRPRARRARPARAAFRG